MKEHRSIPVGPPRRIPLDGRLQITTARDALMRTGGSPDAVVSLSTMLNLHRTASEETSNRSRTILRIRLRDNPRGDQLARMLGSLHQVTQDEKASPSLRTASGTLWRILMKQGGNS